MANLKRVLWHLLGGTRGGPLRIRILMLLRERPYNTNQIALMLGVDYKTAQHHMRVLVENHVVSSTGSGYGAVFLFTRDMEESLAEFDAISRKVVLPPHRAPGPVPGSDKEAIE
ncbi:MAG: ArsR/SmtB family transcription factor [Thermoplasmatota archaeon]